jgi:peptide chain release factor 1
MEIRAGVGGDEGALFARDLYQMYRKYCEDQGWKVEILELHPTEMGGFKEVILGIEGEGAYRTLQYESGGHRVQRVPETEAKGRIHTSAATVAVLPEPEDVEVELNREDYREDIYHASGPGGQHVNKTASAIRLTHLETNIVVTCQDEKSQHKNRAKALRVLKTRIYEHMQRLEDAKRSAERKSQVGSGDRSQRIRTYNFSENRITDHRINFTIYKLDHILTGQMDPLINACKEDARQKQREAFGAIG